MPEPITAPVEKKEITSNDSTFKMLVENFEETKGAAKKDEPTKTIPVVEASDLTESFKEKFAPLQKEGNAEAISKLREEITQALKDGKTVSDELLKQMEIPVTAPDEKIKALEVEKQRILGDLKLNKEQKEEAIAKLETATKKKPFWEEEDFISAPIVEDKDVEAKKHADLIKSYEEKSKKYDAIESDSFIRAYLEAKESGKPVGDFLSDLQKDNPANLTNEQLLEKRIVREGLTTEEAEEEREKFNSLSPIEKKKVIAAERELANKDYQKNIEKYSTTNAAEKERTLSVAKQAIKDKNDYLQNLKDKEKWGITYDSTQISKLEEYANNVMQNGLFTKDGTWDVPRIMRLGMMENNMKHMLQKAHETGKTEGLEESFEKYGRPSKSNGIAGKPDVSIINKEKSEEDKQAAEFNKKRGINPVEFAH